MNFIKAVLNRPYTVGALVALLTILSFFELSRMPVDIFPDIDIPVVSVVWTYNGMPADEIQNRILTIHQRQLASLVDDIEKIEATSYYGVGVEKIYLHEGADISRAVSQLSSAALVSLKYMPRNIVPPLILRYGATDVPIIQLSLSSPTLADNELNDYGQNIIRPALAVVHGAEVPQPYGGKPRVVMVDLNVTAMQEHGVSAQEVSDALQRQNVVMPAGNAKMGSYDWPIKINNTANAIEKIQEFPIKQIGDTTIFIRDVAHVHDGFQIQTNSVSVNGQSGVLMTIRKTGRISTLSVIDGVNKALPDIKNVLPSSLKIKPLFDQSVFVKASINSVLMGGVLAALLTALMILLFLGDARLTLIIVCSIPVSILIAVLIMGSTGMTLNTMTLGGFALAVGILVDNATVVIENIERHAAMNKSIVDSIVEGAAEVGLPTALATLCISIVFVPIYLLEGTAHYLFSPLSTAVILALAASLLLSFTLVPMLFKILMSPHGTDQSEKTDTWVALIHHAFERRFEQFRRFYEYALERALNAPRAVYALGLTVIVLALVLFPFLGKNFFPKVDAGQFRLHIRAQNGTRIEQTQQEAADVERMIRRSLGDQQIQSVITNVGLPYSGLNLALSDSATVGPMDGEMLVSLTEHHAPVEEITAQLRRELPKQFAHLTFFFQPADIVNQVLNFGQPAPIDIRVQGKNLAEAYALANELKNAVAKVPGVVDAHVFQVPESPAFSIEIDRSRASSLGLSQQDIATNVLLSTNSSAQLSPNFYVDPKTGVSYPLVVQVPTYRLSTPQELLTMPTTTSKRTQQVLGNVATVSETSTPLALSQLNLRPVVDVHADVQGIDLGSASNAIEKVIQTHQPQSTSGLKVSLAGQIETMQESFNGIFLGIGFAIILVYLILMINFQSAIDPLVVLGAIPFTLSGVVIMLFVTQTTLSVPALMGALMCIGLTTANSILVVNFAREQERAGLSVLNAARSAGFTRLRPVLMTAGAMMIGMIPMALGVGEGGEQNAPLARAVIGGLSIATVATLVIVPLLFVASRSKQTKDSVGDFMNSDKDKIIKSEIEMDLRQEPYTHVEQVDSPRFNEQLKRLRWAFGAVLLLIILVSVTKFARYQQLVTDAKAEAANSQMIEVISIKRADSQGQVILPARIEAMHSTRIQARVNGYIDQMMVDIGDRVKKGQVLALLSTPELDAELNAAKAQLASAETRKALAQRLEDRIKQTLPGAVSDQERDQRQSELSSSNSDVVLAKAKVDQYQAMAQFKRVTAPFDGVIKSRFVDVGTLVTAGSTSATSLFDVVEDDPLRVFADVPEFVSLSQSVDAKVESLDGGQVIKAKSSRSAGGLDDVTRTRTVEWDVDNHEHRWLPGMQAKITLLKPATRGFTVPITSVLFKSEGPFVAVVNGNNTVHWVPVSILEDNGKSMVVSGELSEGQKLIKSASISIKESATVSIKAADSK